MAKRSEELLVSSSLEARLGAAHFFNRATVNHIPLQSLIVSALEDKNALVRMASTNALRKSATSDHLSAIKKILSTDSDYRVRVSAARVAASKTSEMHDALVILALADTNSNVAISAAEGIRSDFIKKNELLSIARNTTNIRVRSLLFKLLLNTQPDLEKEITTEFEQSTNSYNKSFLIQALSSHIEAHPFLAKQMIESTEPVIKTSAALALVSLNRSKNFTDQLLPIFANAYRSALLTGDVGVISIIAPTLADTVLNFKTAYSDFSFLYEAKKKLVLPKDYEALQPLNEAIAYFEGNKKPQPPQNEFNHPINWKLINKVSKTQKVEIATTKGVIVLQLFVEEAPGSVANFVDLINQKYFDGRFVHRVVPNFVMQAGCNRGDGFGSEAYSIRSEFSLRRYTEGTVGMASAGKDTEGTQWFITHSPTPHLNGKYSIFACVVSGMEVVHKIEIGDQILSAHLVDN
jgi:cyclophilin family peptidyl-prolyl cis-trans isomerase